MNRKFRLAIIFFVVGFFVPIVATISAALGWGEIGGGLGAFLFGFGLFLVAFAPGLFLSDAIGDFLHVGDPGGVFTALGLVVNGLIYAGIAFAFDWWREKKRKRIARDSAL